MAGTFFVERAKSVKQEYRDRFLIYLERGGEKCERRKDFLRRQETPPKKIKVLSRRIARKAILPAALRIDTCAGAHRGYEFESRLSND